MKADTIPEDFEDEELLALAQSQLATSAVAAQKTIAAAGHNPGRYDTCTTLPLHSNTQEALDEAEEIAELVRLANSTIQPDPAAAQHDEMPESSTDAADRSAETSTSYLRASAPSWSGADIVGDSMSVTLKDGRRAFCKLHDSRQEAPAYDVCNQRKMLLSSPISHLMQQVEQDVFAKAVEASTELQKGVTSSKDAVMHAGSSQPAKQALWVDKYSPRSFFELLSDEQINREVIKWVKSWDACVHKKAGTQTGSMATQPQLAPEQKLLLLSGPPGADLHFQRLHLCLCYLLGYVCKMHDHTDGPQLVCLQYILACWLLSQA